jgi:hypothetical protein
VGGGRKGWDKGEGVRERGGGGGGRVVGRVGGCVGLDWVVDDDCYDYILFGPFY